MTEKDLLAEAMDADPVPPPPADLARQVVEAMQARAAPAAGTVRPARSRRLLSLAIALSAGAAIGAGGTVWQQRAPAGGFASGDRRPSAKETIRIGSRAVLVAEAGADLRWRPGPEGAVLVEQSAGAVFYRVNEGPFLVETPHGLVRVQGTCFRVEVKDMKRFDRPNLTGAVLGAALSAAVVVSVYEGRVLLAKGSDEVALGPGESGQITADGRPERRAPASGEASPAGDRAALARPSIPRFEETETLRARIAEQEKELADLRATAPLARKVGESKERYLEPDQAELLDRAARCEVAYDSPSINGFNAKDTQSMGLAEGERETMNEVMKDLKTQVIADMRELYVEMSGDPTIADRLSLGSMESEIFSRAPEGARARARQQLAREKAGLVAPPADLAQTPVAERTLRLMMTIGDRYEQKLAERLGPERTRALRAKQDGWPGKTVFNGCYEQ